MAAAATVAADMAAAKAAAVVEMAMAAGVAADTVATAAGKAFKAAAKEQHIEGRRARSMQTRQPGESMSRCATPFGVGRRLRRPKHAG